jgi:hypothetical protein
MNANAIINALREAENLAPLTIEDHNRKEAEREVEMLLRGEGHLYRYAPFTTQ